MMHSSLVRIRKKTAAALHDYQMIQPEDKVLVGISGGIDSSVMLLTLLEIQKKANFPFSLQPVYLDQKFPDIDATSFTDWVKDLGVNPVILSFDTCSIVEKRTKPGKSICRVCSRLRRGILYTYASEHGYDKIALGHQMDDYNETLLLNMVYAGKLSSMSPCWKSNDDRNCIIRPLSYVPKSLIVTAAETLSLPIISCDYCQISLKNSGREQLKQIIKSLEKLNPDCHQNMFAAQRNIDQSRLPFDPNNKQNS